MTKTILGIETSGDICSVAIIQDDEIKCSYSLTRNNSHSEVLLKMIDECLLLNQIDKRELSAIAVSDGPGSYTGLRIGASTAKGLCMGLDIPLISVSTLLSMANEVKKYYTKEDILLCPMIDARRMEVYYSMYNTDLTLVHEPQPMILDQSSFGDTLRNKKVLFFGNGSPKFQNIIDQPNAFFIEDIHPRARYVCHLASKKFDLENFEDADLYEPAYLKSPIN
jgi:tRNA threonylcarbamoyladenosine biosynthesis protein TsaB